jgi:hypothetical protein
LGDRRQPMAPPTLRSTICETRDALHALRKTVLARGHVGPIKEIDVLLGIAEELTIQAIRQIDSA